MESIMAIILKEYHRDLIISALNRESDCVSSALKVLRQVRTHESSPEIAALKKRGEDVHLLIASFGLGGNITIDKP
jgi:hypothetical protein